MSELNLTTEVFAQHESGRIVYAVVDDKGATRAYMIDGCDDEVFINFQDALNFLDREVAEHTSNATE